ncbi:hypothetical protein J6590_008071 [Homalodisca vitripennis]|nr:hypothetical protein J6590_008071 [Homalodisca vitripennis]
MPEEGYWRDSVPLNISTRNNVVFYYAEAKRNNLRRPEARSSIDIYKGTSVRYSRWCRGGCREIRRLCCTVRISEGKVGRGMNHHCHLGIGIAARMTRRPQHDTRQSPREGLALREWRLRVRKVASAPTNGDSVSKSTATVSASTYSGSISYDPQISLALHFHQQITTCI